MTNHLTNGFHVVRQLVAVLVLALGVHCSIQASDSLKALREIADLAQRAVVDDELLITKAEKHLSALSGRWDNASSRQKAQTVRMAGNFRTPVDTAPSEESVMKRRAVLQRFVLREIPDPMDGPALLHFSAGLAGIPIDQQSLLRFANNGTVPGGLRLVALEALTKQPSLSPGIMGDLEKLLEDGWRVEDPQSLGRPTPLISYPLRDLARQLLDQLNSQREKERQDITIDANAHNRLKSEPAEPQASSRISDPGFIELVWILVVVAAGVFFWVLYQRRKSER